MSTEAIYDMAMGLYRLFEEQARVTGEPIDPDKYVQALERTLEVGK